MRVAARRGVVAAVALAVLSCVQVSAAPSAAAAGPDLVLEGHGFGHGRGLGQYGSLGYALAGTSSAQILDHYYGGTVAGTVPSTTMSVQLESASGQPLRVQTTDVGVATITDGGAVLGSGHAVMVERIGAGSFRISDADTCAGPWTPRAAPVAAGTVRLQAARGNAPAEFGIAGDLPVIGDWNRDGRDTLGVFRGGSGAGTFFLRNATTNGPVDTSFEFGFGSDVPLVGDWDGDGTDTAGVFRRTGSTGTFYLRNSNSNGAPSAAFEFGFATDTPIVGDWDGDGRDSVGVFRNNGGSGSFFVRNALSNGPASAGFAFGFGTDVPVIGDWDGNGVDGIGVRRGADFYLRNALSNGPVDGTITFGAASGTVPFAGDFDNDGRDTVGVRQGTAFQFHGAALELLGGSDNPLGSTLQLCGSGTNATWYRGELRAVDAEGTQKAVNVLDLEAYVRGVVPRESPASWGTQGCQVSPCLGLQALQAQAVAARSYSLAENRHAWAKTCDTTSCQVYGGRQSRVNGVVTVLEQATTDAAVAATAGVVRLRNGVVARTEFSSSTGGVTAGGEYPSVVDTGDAVASNPNHTWRVTITAATLEARYGRTGFQYLEILTRTAADGGHRVATARLHFASGNVDRTGDQIRQEFQLRSNWFDPVGGGGGDRVGVARPGSGPLQIFLRNTHSAGAPDTTFGYGGPGDVPVAGDWNGDGRSTIGIFRAGTFYLRNSNTSGVADLTFGFGFASDRAVVGDWNGDGVDTIGVYRPSEGRFYLRNSNTNGPPDLTLNFGVSSDRPIVGDWDGDGDDTVGVFRAAGGAGRFLLRNSNTTGIAEIDYEFGFATDLPIVGDWDGDGDVTPGVYRSTGSNGFFYLRNTNSNGAVDLQYSFGLAGDLPLAGSW